MIKVNSISHLKELAYNANGDFVEFNLYLANGLERISYRPDETKEWLIINEIDNSYQELKDVNLSKKTPIVEAIDKGVFYLLDIP
jgi:hypothetical protein